MNIASLPSDPRYRVSDDGTVFGLSGKPLRPWMTTGYKEVSIGGTKRYVHDLVLETFVGPKPKGACVRHGVLGPLVNSIENICYGTYSENEQDKVRDGTHQQASKTHCPQRHEYTPENTRISYARNGTVNRLCRTCQRQHIRNFRARRKEFSHA